MVLLRTSPANEAGETDLAGVDMMGKVFYECHACGYGATLPGTLADYYLPASIRAVCPACQSVTTITNGTPDTLRVKP